MTDLLASRPRPEIRTATHEDVGLLLRFIRELADYENSSEHVEVDEGMLDVALFGSEPSAYARLAVLDGEPAGMVIYSRMFSTWTGRPSLYVVDLYVRSAHRGLGVGRALLGAIARLAMEEGAARVEWAVLDWNEPALAFYRSLGAVPLDGWTTYRLAGPALSAFAELAG